MDQEPVATKVNQPIRKSCHFCRARKIRCSGQQVCAACAARNIDCVYGREASKGRPRGSMSATIPAKSTSQADLDPKSPTTDTTLNNDGAVSSSIRSSSSHKPSSVEHAPNPSISSKDRTIGEMDIATELAQRFRKLSFDRFSPQSGEGFEGHPLVIDSGRGGFSGHKRKLDERNDAQVPPRLAHLDCEQLLSSLTQDLVESVAARFSSLGFCKRHNIILHWFTMSLVQDKVPGMFDPNSAAGTPPKFSDHQVCQMLELWFFHHPLSFILSKSLFLHGYRNGKHDESLLATILGGARSCLKEEESNLGDSLFQWAQSQLCRRNASHLSLATIQALILLGWNELCSSNPRRGFCYISISRSAVISHHSLLKAGYIADVEFINGLNVGKVELELCQRIYWLTFALELWASLQGSLPFPGLLPSGVDIFFPPFDEASSATFTMDKQTNNVATLGAQEKAMRVLWPLSYVSSTVGYIHVLYPRQATQTLSLQTHDWEYQPLYQLRQLLDSPTDVVSVCRKVQDVLSDGLKTFQSNTSDHPFKVLITISYRAIIIHLFFLRSTQGSNDKTVERVLDEIVRSAEAFREVVQELDRPSMSIDMSVDHAKSLGASMVVLGLDTCARALEQLYWMLESRKTIEPGTVLRRYTQLSELSGKLQAVCDHPKLWAVQTAPQVKKNWKRVRRLFEQQCSTVLSPADSPWLEQTSTSKLPTPPKSDLPFAGGNGNPATLPDFFYDSTTMNWDWSNRNDLYYFTSADDSSVQP